jgi:ABC-type transporter MlaC component
MSNVFSRKRMGLAVILTLSVSWHMPAGWGADAKAVVSQILGTISDTPSADAIDAKLSNQVDYATMTQLAFTPSQWSSFSPSQRDQLKSAYRELICKRYYMRWHKLFARSNVKYGDVASANGDTYMKTWIKHAKDDDVVTWRLRDSNGRLALIDINVNDKDLISRLSERSQAELKKLGVPRFIAWLQQEARQTQETASRPQRKSEEF